MVPQQLMTVADADGFVGGDGALRFRDRPARTRKPGDRRPRAPDKSTARDGTECFLHDGIPSKKKKRTVLAKAAKGAKEKKVQSHESKVEITMIDFIPLPIAYPQGSF